MAEIDEYLKKCRIYAEENGFKLNPDLKTAEGVARGLFKNEEKHGKKYCPCRRITGIPEEDGKKVCPCFWHKEDMEKLGHCLCFLYFKK